ATHRRSSPDAETLAAPPAASTRSPRRSPSTPGTVASTAATTGSNNRASRSRSSRARYRSGQHTCASRRRAPRRTPCARAVAEQADTRPPASTATGRAAGTPAAAAAATAGQSWHHTASTRPACTPASPLTTARREQLSRHRSPRERKFARNSPGGGASGGDGTPLHATTGGAQFDSPAPRLTRAVRGGDVEAERAQPAVPGAEPGVAGDPGVHPRGGVAPEAVGDDEDGTLGRGASGDHPGAGGGDPAAAQAEHDQVDAVEQHGGDLDRVGARLWNDRQFAQVGTHLRGGEQAETGQSGDRGVPAVRGGGGQQAGQQRARPGVGDHRPLGEPAAGQQTGEGGRHRQRLPRFPRRGPPPRGRLAAAGHRRHPAPQLGELALPVVLAAPGFSQCVRTHHYTHFPMDPRGAAEHGPASAASFQLSIIFEYTFECPRGEERPGPAPRRAVETPCERTRAGGESGRLPPNSATLHTMIDRARPIVG